jgi:hypothetical protein
MTVSRNLIRTTSRVLARRNLQLGRITRDFDARLDQPDQLARIFWEIGRCADEWLAKQTLFPVRKAFNSADELNVLYEEFLEMPFRDRSGGSRFNNLSWLYLIAKAAQPAVVIDSGTFKGASAWALSRAVPHADAYSFDIDLSQLAYRADGVTFVESDWTEFRWGGIDLTDALVYFDDHLDQARRLIEASAHGIPLAVFDDDFPVTSFAEMAHDGSALPKIEFVLDDRLRECREISWVDRRGRHSFAINPEYLDKARALIGGTDRLPNTSLITGIHQTPYRVVALRHT